MQEVFSRVGSLSLPLAKQEFFELRIEVSSNPNRRGFVVMQSRGCWSEADRQLMWDEIEREHTFTFEAAASCYASRRHNLVERGFTEGQGG